ncbi:MAG: S-layer homology domain-containing protein, partial [Clostridia bacterium]|nr:S-layer homology domain-containing protein [Clostridia bacterium]
MKRTLSILLALVLTFALLPVTALAEETLEDVIYTDSRGNRITIPGGARACAVRVVDCHTGDRWTSYETAMNPENILGAPDYDEATDTNGYTVGARGSITLEFEIFITDGEGMDIYVFEVGPDVEPTRVEVSTDLVNWIDVGVAEGSLSGVDLAGKVPADGKYRYVRITDLNGQGSGWPGADIDAVAGLNAKVPASGSEWANEELAKADAMGLIPDVLQGADLTAPITRAEFAAVSVKVYEALANGEALPAVSNPFVDTSDLEVLKAYNTGITAGVSDTEFAPDALLNREQCATMLTRVFKRVTLPGWTLQTDAQFTLPFDQPAPFADDADIS